MATHPSPTDVEVYDELAGTPETPVTGLSYEDYIELFPDVGNLRRELLEGELIVAPPPTLRHQEVVGEVFAALRAYAREAGGKAFPAPTGVFLAEDTMMEPDVLLIAEEHLDRLDDDLVLGAPDIVVEVSSPSTRRLDTVRKRGLYESFRVPEYWFIDLESDRVEIYTLTDDRYGKPTILTSGEVLESRRAPGLSIDIDQLLGLSG